LRIWFVGLPEGRMHHSCRYTRLLRSSGAICKEKAEIAVDSDCHRPALFLF
jgi:hypothetical protein